MSTDWDWRVAGWHWHHGCRPDRLPNWQKQFASFCHDERLVQLSDSAGREALQSDWSQDPLLGWRGDWRTVVVTASQADRGVVVAVAVVVVVVVMWPDLAPVLTAHWLRGQLGPPELSYYRPQTRPTTPAATRPGNIFFFLPASTVQR